MTKKLKALDAEYVIKKHPEIPKGMVLGVISRELNCSCWLNIDNEYLSRSTIESIWNDLAAMENSMVYQKSNELLYND